MLGRQGQSFTCFCNSHLDPQEESSFKQHIVLCQQFQRNSPITQFFNSINFDQRSLEELFIIKSELELKLEEVKTYIEIQSN